MTRGEIHPEARAIIQRVLPLLVRALRPAGLDAAVVVVAPGRDVDLGAGAVEGPDGIRYAVVPRDQARVMADEMTLQLGELLREELEPGAAWCLVLGPRGSAAVPLVMDRRGPRA